MSSERDELIRLVGELDDAEVHAVLREVRERSHVQRPRSWPPALFGSGMAGATDTAARVDELLAEGFGR